MVVKANRCAQVDIATPEVFIGGLLGAMLVFLFSAWAIIAVGRSAQAVVNEVQTFSWINPPLQESILAFVAGLFVRLECADVMTNVLWLGATGSYGNLQRWSLAQPAVLQSAGPDTMP